jgi:natural product precursor
MKKNMTSLDKLALNKQTIIQLDKSSMRELKGGRTDGASSCGACRPTVKTSRP